MCILSLNLQGCTSGCSEEIIIVLKINDGKQPDPNDFTERTIQRHCTIEWVTATWKKTGKSGNEKEKGADSQYIIWIACNLKLKLVLFLFFFNSFFYSFFFFFGFLEDCVIVIFLLWIYLTRNLTLILLLALSHLVSMRQRKCTSVWVGARVLTHTHTHTHAQNFITFACILHI